MKKTLLVFSLLWLSIGITVAQSHRTCGTMEYYEMMKAQDPGYEDRMNSLEQLIQSRIANDPSFRINGTVTIPVVFHILYNTNNTSQNISLARINAQLERLNQDFAAGNADTSLVPAPFKPLIANTAIQFCLAVRDPFGNATTGVIRKQTATTNFSVSNNKAKFDSTGGDNAWPRDSYLNLWVAPNIYDSFGNPGILGYSQFPGGVASTDGVVLLAGAVGGPGALGTATPYHLGRTATHEIGHWLNLRHINGDSFCGTDFVTDTPTQQQLNFNCPAFPKVSCSNGPNGDMFNNYMDYTDDDCMLLFTPGQATRMNTAITSSRPLILNSLGCVPVSIGLDELNQNGISVYPNPTQGQLTIENTNNETGSTVVNVYNLVGQTLLTVDYSEFRGVNQLDLSALSNGLYFVEIRTQKSNGIYRITLDK